MRHFTMAIGLAFAMTATFAMVPAKAEFNAPTQDGKGQCRFAGSNNDNLFYYWAPCPKPAATAVPQKPTHHRKG